MSRARTPATPTGASGRRTWWPVAVATAVLFGSWELYGRLKDSIILPPLSSVAAAFADLIASGRLLEAAIPSLQLLAAGLATSTLLGLAIGFLLGRARLADRLLGPYVSALYATPEVALIPILIVWFGYGFTGRLVIVVLAGVFAMIYNVRAGVLAAPPDLEDMARSFNASKATILFRVVLPAARPFIVAGLRQSIGRSIVGMILAEAFLRLGGLGGLVFTYGARFATDYLLASVIVLPVLGVALTRLVDIADHRLSPWRRA